MKNQAFWTSTTEPVQFGRPRLTRLAGAIARWMLRSVALYQERRALSEMDDRMLGDIGLTRAQARRESDRGFWDHPER